MTQKNYALETVRGIAALFVVYYHLLLAGFAPRSGNIRDFDIYNTHILSVFNGGFAVYLFFILSGYVLTIKYIQTQDKKYLIKQAIKRYPRLSILIFISTLISWLVYIFDFTLIFDSAKLSKADWFLDYPNPKIDDSFTQVLKQSFYQIFLSGNSDYNVVMWTMKYEFFGSFISLFLVYLLFFTHNKWLNLSLFFLFNLIIFKIDATYISFSLGIMLGFWQKMQSNFKLNIYTALFFVFIGLILGSKDNYIGLIDSLYWQVTQQPLRLNSRYCFVVGGFFIVAAVLFNARLAGWLNTKFGKFLGEISFPLYLVHIPIIFSLGGYLFLKTQSQFLTSIGVLFISVLLSWPLAKFDILYVKWLNKKVNNLF